jgi:hypothetical protein
MPDSTGYQQLPQDLEDETLIDEEVSEGHTKAARGRSLLRAHKPGHIDLRKLDNAFKRYASGYPAELQLSMALTHVFRWTESIAQKVKRKKKVEDYSRKEIWQSVFEPCAPPFAVGNGSEFVVSLVLLASSCMLLRRHGSHASC